MYIVTVSIHCCYSSKQFFYYYFLITITYYIYTHTHTYTHTLHTVIKHNDLDEHDDAVCELDISFKYTIYRM